MTDFFARAREQFSRGDFVAALRLLDKLPRKGMFDADSVILRAELNDRLGNARPAAEAYAAAIDLSEQHRYTLGFRAAQNFLSVGDAAAAISVLTRLQAYLPDDPDIAHSLCSLYREAGNYPLALPHARKLVAVGRNFGNFLNAGVVLSGLGYFEEAYPPLLKAYIENSEERLALSELFWCAANLCDLSLSAQLQVELEAAYRREGALADIRENAFRALVWSEDEAYHRACAQKTAQMLLPQPAPPWRQADRRDGPIRIGYVSADFCDHATMALLAGVLEAHDHAEFEIFGFCHTPQSARKGAMRQRFLDAIDHYCDILDIDDEEAAARIRAMDIDILVDLKGFTQSSRLGIFSRRPAPRQVTYLGFPGSVAGACMDYAITDFIVTPDQSLPHYEEKLLRLEGAYQCNDNSRERVERRGNRAAHGLPDDAIVFCSFNQAQKIRPAMFAAWMQVLGRVEGSVLWLASQPKLAETNLRNTAEAVGVSGDRLIFAEKLPLDAHLRRVAEADLALDTSPYNGHTTTSDALWAGVPVVTVRGRSFAGRVSESLLSAVGLPELVADDFEAFVELAVELAQNAERRNVLRQHLLSARERAPLFDTRLFTQRLEEQFRHIMTEL